jgi:hypothetical protein
VYAFFAAYGWTRLLGSLANRVMVPLAAAAALFAGIAAAKNVSWYYAEAQSTEIRVVDWQLGKYDLGKLKKLWLIPSTWDDAVTEVRYDEFGLPSSSQLWAQIPLVYVVATKELGSPPEFEIVATAPGQKLGPDEGLVDMTRLAHFALP